MSDYYFPVSVPAQTQRNTGLADTGCNALIQLATIGAVVGASAAASANIHRLRRAEIDAPQALLDTGRAALTSALASAVAGAAANAVAGQGLVRLAVLLAAGTAVMYGIQSRLDPVE